jgi:hypothetical protein
MMMIGAGLAMDSGVCVVFDLLHLGWGCMSRDKKAKDRPARRPILGPDPAAMRIDDSAADRKPEPRS